MGKYNEAKYLLQYREEIRAGNIKAGADMVQELDNLIVELNEPEYL